MQHRGRLDHPPGLKLGQLFPDRRFGHNAAGAKERLLHARPPVGEQRGWCRHRCVIADPRFNVLGIAQAKTLTDFLKPGEGAKIDLRVTQPQPSVRQSVEQLIRLRGLEQLAPSRLQTHPSDRLEQRVDS